MVIEYVIVWLHGFLVSWFLGFMVAWLHGCMVMLFQFRYGAIKRKVGVKILYENDRFQFRYGAIKSPDII